jgi:hypothetical protein
VLDVAGQADTMRRDVLRGRSLHVPVAGLAAADVRDEEARRDPADLAATKSYAAPHPFRLPARGRLPHGNNGNARRSFAVAGCALDGPRKA